MRIAVVADIHGNAPALRAVLGEVDRTGVDAIVVAGDIAGGPLVPESLGMLQERSEPVHWIRGNAERETVAAFDGAMVPVDDASRLAAWTARAIDRRWRDELAGWPIACSVDNVRFCHGSPRHDDLILTKATPTGVIATALTGVTEPLVIGGHTHQQFIRRLSPDLVFANAGSVGLPYEGSAGAYWMTVIDGEPTPRQTRYDIDLALRELRSSGFPDLTEYLSGSLLTPTEPTQVTAHFERQAGRAGPAE